MAPKSKYLVKKKWSEILFASRTRRGRWAIRGLKPGERSSRPHFVKVHPMLSWPHGARHKNINFSKSKREINSYIPSKTLHASRTIN